MSRNGKSRGGTVDWTAIRQEYIVGRETLLQLARRLGVSPRTVRAHAAADGPNRGTTWTEARHAWRESVASDVLRDARERALSEKARQAEAAAQVQRTQQLAVGDLVETGAPVAMEALANGSVTGADAVRLFIAALAYQRKVHGLDRQPLQVEVRSATDDDECDVVHDEVDADFAAFAQEALSALFGEPAPSGNDE